MLEMHRTDEVKNYTRNSAEEEETKARSEITLLGSSLFTIDFHLKRNLATPKKYHTCIFGGRRMRNIFIYRSKTKRNPKCIHALVEEERKVTDIRRHASRCTYTYPHILKNRDKQNHLFAKVFLYMSCYNRTHAFMIECFHAYRFVVNKNSYANEGYLLRLYGLKTKSIS